LLALALSCSLLLSLALSSLSHGILTCGTTIEAAVFRFISLERQCEAELKTGGAGKAIEIGKEEAQFTRDITGTEASAFFQASPYYQQVEADTKGAYKV